MAAPLHNVPFVPRAPSAQGHATPITKSDSTVYSPALSGLWVGGVGDVALLLAGDDTPVTFTAVAAGSFLPFMIKKVMSANTSATLMVGVW